MKEIITERIIKLNSDIITNKQCDTLVLPDSIQIIDDYALCDCRQLKKIIFVDEEGKEVNHKIQEIGSYAFAHTKIKQFIYSHHLKSIGTCAFYDTPLSIFQYQDEDSLESTLKEIGNSAFELTQILDLVIPPSLESFCLGSFDGIRSVLCKDSQGHIVPGFHDFESIHLEEISFLGASWFEVKEIFIKCPRLKKIHLRIDMAARAYEVLFANRLELHEIELILYGSAFSLSHLIGFINDYNQHAPILVNLENVHVGEIGVDFFKYLSNPTLIIPEGVYEVGEFFHYDWQPKRIEFPSTFITFSKPIGIDSVNRQREDMKTTIVIYENIPDDCYKKLSHYLNPLASEIVIKGQDFTWRKKHRFKKLSPSKLPLKFVESNLYTEEELYPLEKRSEKSVYQMSVDEVTDELKKLISFMPSDLQIKIKTRYNRIIDEYRQNRKQEEPSIVSNHPLLVVDSGTDLYTKLLSLKNEIVCNRTAVSKLKEIQECKSLLDSSKKGEIVGVNSIQTMIQTILKVKEQLPEVYFKQIKNRIENLLLVAEEKYKAEMNCTLEEVSSTFISNFNPIEKLEQQLTLLLEVIENPLIQECMDIEKVAEEESTNLNIESLSDHIKTLNYVIRNISSREQKRKEQWEELKSNYNLLFQKTIFAILNETETIDALELLKQQFLVDLKHLVDEVSLISDFDFYCRNKVEEVQSAHNFYISIALKKKRKVSAFDFLIGDKKDEKNQTVTSLLILDLLKIVPNLEKKRQIYIQNLINEKATNTISLLELSTDYQEVDQIMKQFYQFLTDMIFLASEILSYQDSFIAVKKI